MPGRTFTREFKLAIVRQLASGEKRPAQVCREQGWQRVSSRAGGREYAERGEAAFTPQACNSESVRWKPALPSWSGFVANSPWRTRC